MAHIVLLITFNKITYNRQSFSFMMQCRSACKQCSCIWMLRFGEYFFFFSRLNNFSLVHYNYLISNFAYYTKIMTNKNYTHIVLLLKIFYKQKNIFLNSNV